MVMSKGMGIAIRRPFSSSAWKFMVAMANGGFLNDRCLPFLRPNVLKKVPDTGPKQLCIALHSQNSWPNRSRLHQSIFQWVVSLNTWNIQFSHGFSYWVHWPTLAEVLVPTSTQVGQHFQLFRPKNLPGPHEFWDDLAVGQNLVPLVNSKNSW